MMTCSSYHKSPRGGWLVCCRRAFEEVRLPVDAAVIKPAFHPLPLVMLDAGGVGDIGRLVDLAALARLAGRDVAGVRDEPEMRRDRRRLSADFARLGEQHDVLLADECVPDVGRG